MSKPTTGPVIRKKLVYTRRGDSLPPVQESFTDDSRNSFEIDLTPEKIALYGSIELFVGLPGMKQWTQVAQFIIEEEV